jgi:hypothetical protein
MFTSRAGQRTVCVCLRHVSRVPVRSPARSRSLSFLPQHAAFLSRCCSTIQAHVDIATVCVDCGRKRDFFEAGLQMITLHSTLMHLRSLCSEATSPLSPSYPALRATTTSVQIMAVINLTSNAHR